MTGAQYGCHKWLKPDCQTLYSLCLTSHPASQDYCKNIYIDLFLLSCNELSASIVLILVCTFVIVNVCKHEKYDIKVLLIAIGILISNFGQLISAFTLGTAFNAA